MSKNIKKTDRRRRIIKTSGRQAQWEAIKKLQIFTIAEVSKKSKEKLDTCRLYISLLVKAKIVEEVVNQPFETSKFQLKKDVGFHHPRIRKDGTRIPDGNTQDAIWRLMRLFKKFSFIELDTALRNAGLETHLGTIKGYIQSLAKAGYLKRLDQPNPRQIKTYLLVKNSGPKPPIVQKVNRIFDPNLKEITWREDDEEISL
ncbi:hypothetical protein [uncultured Kiloniella sp.]|uniref:hypothetical protein n=1 Tax=uncultured Kiloniella sp. TaxID=1133091 RepID=UPI002636460A|nr:hypothetical protein [uncultured Kiloniella sp.]